MTSSITVSPLFQELTLDDASASVVREVTITNNTQLPLEVQTQLGKLTSDSLEGPPVGVPAELVDQLPFVKVLPTKIQVAPNASASVQVTFTQSAELNPGGNYVAAVFSFSEQPSAPAQVIPAVSSVFFVTKKGSERYQLTLEKLDTPSVRVGYPKELSVSVQNTGNTHIIPSGKISFLRGDKQLARGIINQDSRYLFQGQALSFTTEVMKLERSWPIERLEVRVELNPYQEGVAKVESSHMVIIQPTALFLMVVGLIAVLFIGARRIRHEA
jgi:hypothetical protein